MLRILVHNYYNNTAGFADSLAASKVTGRASLALAMKLASIKDCRAELYSTGDDDLLALSLPNEWNEAERVAYIIALNSALKPKMMHVDAVTCSHSDCTGEIDFNRFFKAVKKAAPNIKTIELNDEPKESAADIYINSEQLGTKLSEVFKSKDVLSRPNDLQAKIEEFLASCQTAHQQISSGKAAGF